MKDRIIDFLAFLPREIYVFLISVLPIIELRGAIPVGAAIGLPFYVNYPVAVLGNLLPVPFILAFIPWILEFMHKHRILRKLVEWVWAKAEKYTGKIIVNAECRMQNAEFLLRGVKESASLLMQERVDFEFRTTLMKELHTEDDIRAIGEWLRGDEKLFLQTYREEGDLIVGGFTPFTRDETEALLGVPREYIPNAEIRG